MNEPQGQPSPSGCDPDGDAATTVAELRIDGTGLWAVRSDGPTTYFLDLDRRRLRRVPGPGSSTGPWDNTWVRLLSVTDALHPEETGVVRIGRRPRYDMDPGGFHDYIWWIQRTVTSIERVPKTPTGPLGA